MSGITVLMKASSFLNVRLNETNKNVIGITTGVDVHFAVLELKI